MLTLESLKSLYILFDKYLDHMLVKFEQNCMVQTTRNFELFDKKKNVFVFVVVVVFLPFWQNVDAIFEDVSVAETIVEC